MRSIVGRDTFDTFGTPAFHTRADCGGTLVAGGGWTELPHPGGDARACLMRGGGRRELDLAFRPADLLDPHLDRVAQPVRSPTSAADQGGAELVQLEVVPR